MLGSLSDRNLLCPHRLRLLCDACHVCWPCALQVRPLIRHTILSLWANLKGKCEISLISVHMYVYYVWIHVCILGAYARVSCVNSHLHLGPYARVLCVNSCLLACSLRTRRLRSHPADHSDPRSPLRWLCLCAHPSDRRRLCHVYRVNRQGQIYSQKDILVNGIALCIKNGSANEGEGCELCSVK